MPRVVDESSNSPVTLLRPKRPPANKPQEDHSFEHALKQAQPKREAAPKPRGQAAKPAAAEEAPAEPDQAAAASIDEAPVDAGAVKVDSEGPVEEVAVKESAKEHPDVEGVAEPVLPQTQTQTPTPITTPIPTNAAAFVDLPSVSSKSVDCSDVASQPAAPVAAVAPATAAIVEAAPIHAPEVPQPAKDTDIPEEAAQLASARIPAQPVSDEPVLDDEIAPTQKPAASLVTNQPGPTNAAKEVTAVNNPSDAPVEAIASVGPVESDQSEVDDGAFKSDTPKVKPGHAAVDPESADDDSPQQVATTPEAASMKESSSHAVLPRDIDAPAPKATVEAKPAIPAALPSPPVPAHADADFAATNHDRIVSSVRSQLLPNGGSMHLRLDPPELGALQIHVRMVDGVMQASFETSNDQATRMLSHSLSQLKNALETQGVSVDRLQVQQSPRDPQSGSSTEDQQRQSQQQDSQAQREQQRRELLNRMWRRMRLGRDPLDMVA